MKSRVALKTLAEVTESQWGLVTSAQARARGVTHMNLTRLTESGDLVRVTHGVYRDAGAPSTEHEELRAAWLAAEPAKPAYERLSERPMSAVISGESAARLHGIGDFRATRSEFTTPTRRQTQRPDVHYRTRVLPEQDVTIRDGLPVTTRERTIADLVEDRQDLSLIGDALRDAAGQSRLDSDRLAELLSPLAERNGHKKGDGGALLNELLRVAGIDFDHLATRLTTTISPDAFVKLAEAMSEALLKRLPVIDPSIYLKFAEVMSEALRKIPTPDLSAVATTLPADGAVNAAQLIKQLTAANWTELTAAAKSNRHEDEQ
ncbi:MAG: type IV toxin-antitoxin system AbiEi family antitoxin domain-containing protein [Tessaracoccus sp.]|uniref:type IV toxin-antitoxin system AbiEi family antitoxin domain-containing protein n=1 Tax=Tessaracoccus sp. TaxID=1971211 RepID=UPI001EBAB8E8|nr:type IV toxin-antitoxin system AbiEi family antitoxin domain-containing protein [Tessaracoccus sp.]MBK7822787.1 type IV toxin-antitoxin system AbiEi family antitoxin domain-containing protein [Tessaracoccus sp.]